MPLTLRIVACIAVIALAAIGLACTAEPDEQKDPIIFNDLGWDSALSQNRIAQYIVEMGYEYPTGVVSGATVDLFEGLRRGNSDVMMELWLPNHAEAWQDATEAGEVVSLGESLGKLAQSAFMIPSYVQEDNPELDSVDDLKQERFRAIFAGSDSDGRARLVSCPEGWACNLVNETQVNAYGLSGAVKIVVPESESALHQELFDRYEDNEPWLGYLDTSMAPFLKLDMVRLEEPPYTNLCWATTKACGYDDTTLLIAARPELLMRAPEVAAMLRKWGLSSDDYRSLVVWRLDQEETHAAAALWWLKENHAVWSQWVSEEAAEAIREALDGGELPAGWPTE